jgi:HlyD family secretion protein
MKIFYMSMNTQKTKYRLKKSMLKIAGLSVFILLIILLSMSCKSNKSGEYSVMSGSFRQTVIETGELEAIKASYIMMPRIPYQYGYQFKIIGLTEHGKLVHKGDSIIKLDPSSVYKYIIEREDMLENELAAAKKQSVQSENNIQELMAQLRSEQAAYDLNKIEVERSVFDTDVKKRIKELELKQATVRLNRVKRNLALKPQLDNYDRKIQRIRVIQRESELKSAREALKQFLIRSPLDGTFQVAVNKNSANPQSWKLGDSPYQGYIIASIPDITFMKAKTYINEAEITKVKPGMKVIVRLDALPSVPFNGSITEISKICFSRDREKVFNVTVEISDSDPRLKPGMTVNCEYVLYESDNEVFVPNNCLLKEMGLTYIFVKKGVSVKKIEVKSGPANSTHTIIYTEFEQGQRLIPFSEVINS